MVPMEVMDEIRSLRKIVEQHLAGFAWGESARSEPVKTDILRQMLDAGFSPQFARDLLHDLPREMNGLEAMAWVKGGADRSLMTIGSDNDIVDRGGKDNNDCQAGGALCVASWSEQGCSGDH